MWFFKFKRNENSKVKKPMPTPEPASILRTKARNRLIGSVVLLLIAVIGFPLIFSQQPRPISNDLTIVIPNKKYSVVNPDAITNVASGGVQAAADLLKTQDAVADTAKAVVNQKSAKPAVLTVPSEPIVAAQNHKSEVPIKSIERTVPTKVVNDKKAANIVPSKTEIKKAAPDESQEVMAILEGRVSGMHASKNATEKDLTSSGDSVHRLIVQIGAFSTDEKAREVRSKLERAGLKTYVQEVNGQEGRRIRVRLGPFSTSKEAQEMAAKARHLGYETSIIGR